MPLVPIKETKRPEASAGTDEVHRGWVRRGSGGRLDYELGKRSIRLVFAELKGPVKDRLRRYVIAPPVAP